MSDGPRGTDGKLTQDTRQRTKEDSAKRSVGRHPSVVPGLVSTIIPVHNRAPMVSEAVASVLAQTYRPIEIIIVDDGSTDETPRFVDQLAAQNPNEILVVHQANGGPGLAREAGRELAQGEFIQYLDSDDLYSPTKVALQVAALRANLDRNVSYCCVELRSLSAPRVSDPLAWGRSGETIDVIFPDILRGRYWCTSSSLYRRSLVDQVGPWQTMRDEEDVEYDIRAACLGARAIHVPEFLVTIRHHGGRMSLDFKSPQRLRDQTASRLLVFHHILRSGIGLRDPSVQHFAQGLFLYARQIGALGLTREAERCLSAARRILRHRDGGDYKSRLYGWLTLLCGHRMIGGAAEGYDRIRRALKRQHA